MKKAVPDKIKLDEFFAEWPKTPDGFKARRLMLEYLYSLLLTTTAGVTANRGRAQAEMGAHKAIAKITEDVHTIANEKPEVKPVKMSPPLRRFQPTKPENEPKK